MKVFGELLFIGLGAFALVLGLTHLTEFAGVMLTLSGLGMWLLVAYVESNEGVNA